jgi:hypothetical protein
MSNDVSSGSSGQEGVWSCTASAPQHFLDSAFIYSCFVSTLPQILKGLQNTIVELYVIAAAVLVLVLSTTRTYLPGQVSRWDSHSSQVREQSEAI